MPLLHRIEAFLKRTGMSPTSFGREAAGDPKLVHDLRCGREPRRATERRILRWIEDAEGRP
jgi:hypothetical protein